MIHANRPITGREYKLMLDVYKFKERDEGIKNFLDSLESQIKLLKNVQSREVRFEKEIKEEKRIVWYLDTKTFELNKPPNYFLESDERTTKNMLLI